MTEAEDNKDMPKFDTTQPMANNSPGAGISNFVTSLNLLSVEQDGRRRRTLNKDVLKGFKDHPRMAASIIKNTIISNLSREGSEGVHSALKSRWRKIRVNPIKLSAKDTPVAISVEIVFILEHTDQVDSTDEVFDILDKNIEKSNHNGFIAQLVVNNRVKRYS